ncbi:MAG: hypothetical protein HRU19_31320 [Pseudobacteriovorax sp.]|nr:hypothetical protein [Pseudobacteriovorax sp.]
MSQGILFVDCDGFKPLPSNESLRLISQGLPAEFSSEICQAKSELKKPNNAKILVSNNPDLELFQQYRQTTPQGKTILVTSLPMHEYSAKLNNQEDSLVDHIISNRNVLGWTIHDLRVTLAKLISGDVFGIEKYLSPNTKIYKEVVRSSKERDFLNNKVMQFAQECHLGQHTSRMAFGITEELLMNTIYDAPAAAGIERFQNIDQTTEIELEEQEYGTLSYGCDGRMLAIASSDPFGALRKEKVLSYLKKVLNREKTEGLIDTKKGGAGLGLFKILYSSHAIICNVAPQKHTEIMALVDINEQLRDFSSMARSVHYFYG